MLNKIFVPLLIVEVAIGSWFWVTGDLPLAAPFIVSVFPTFAVWFCLGIREMENRK